MYHEIGKSGSSWGTTHQSHKLIAAHKILAIQKDTFDDQPVTRFIFEGIPSVTVLDTDLQNKPVPEAGMYVVAYTDGYFSFSPAKQFEEGNTPLIDLGIERAAAGIGWAVKQLHNGSRVRRAGWNGKGMYLYLVPADSYPARTAVAKAEWGENGLVPYQAYIAMKTAQGTVVPWLASQTDLLASDWEIAA